MTTLLNHLINKYRTKCAVTIVDKNNAIRLLINILKKNGAVCVFSDQRATKGAKVKFFGKETIKPKSAYSLAYQFECPVVPINIKRKKGVYFDVEIHSPIYVNTLAPNKDEAVLKAAEITNSLFESWILEAPGDWLCTKKCFFSCS